MKTLMVFLIAGLAYFPAAAQPASDSMVNGTVTIIKDPRIDVLGRKMSEYNDDLSFKPRSGKGYRLMVISTSDRDLAMRLRTELYQYFPEQKQYMSYQLPNIKIKFGNFEDKADADKMRKLILDMKLVTNNIYVVPETIEIKPEKKDPSKDDN